MSVEVGQTTMQEIHELMTAEFGRMAGPLKRDGMVQTVSLPGGTYSVVITPANGTAVQVFQRVGDVDLSHAGLGEFLLREHARWVFGRLELAEQALLVSNSVLLAQLSAETLRGMVVAVHRAACKTEELLNQTGVLRADDEADE